MQIAALLFFVCWLVHVILASPALHKTRKPGQQPSETLPIKHFNGVKRSVPPIVAPTSLVDDISRFVDYAGSTYCTDLAVGHKLGSDGSILWTMGDGGTIQRVYIAYSPSIGIVVSYEGTIITSFGSIADDLTFALMSPWEGLEWLEPGVKIGRGFQEGWDDSAKQVLEQVKKARDRYPDAAITLTGHSLGAAIALLGALHLSHELVFDVKVVVFGMPRVGNREFAHAVDQYLSDQSHIVNYRDVVPHLPSKTLGYQHPLGEIWVANDKGDLIYQCPGYENNLCSDSIPIAQSSVGDHSGPYFGLMMSCTAEPPSL